MDLGRIRCEYVNEKERTRLAEYQRGDGNVVMEILHENKDNNSHSHAMILRLCEDSRAGAALFRSPTGRTKEQISRTSTSLPMWSPRTRRLCTPKVRSAVG